MSLFNRDSIYANIIESALDQEQTINLLCCVNDKYVEPLINLMYSIRNFSGRAIKLYILTCGISSKKEKLLKEKLDFLNIDLWLKTVSAEKFKSKLNGWSEEIFLKSFAFDLIPAEVEKILYLDADILAVGDISLVYDVEIDKEMLACCLDVDFASPDVYGRRRNLNIKNDYFNGGVLLLNLKEQRKNWTREYVENLILNTNCYFPTQDYLNIMCSDYQIKILPYKCNFQCWWEINSEEDLKVMNPILIHYINPNKPWINRVYDNYTTTLFFECAEITQIANFNPGEYLEDRLEENINNSKKSTDRKISLLSCINDAYKNPLINLMYSIRQYNDAPIDYYVMSTSFSEESKEEMQRVGERLNINVVVIMCELPAFEIGQAYWSLDMYLRILSYEYLPKDLDKILYLDADIQAFNDIAEIYDIDISNHLLAARIEPWRFKDEKIVNSCKENEINHEYFNSGVLILNLERIRKEWNRDKIFHLITTLKLYFPDQDVLNKLCDKEDLLELAPRYNYFDLWVVAYYRDLNNRNPVLMHYVSGGKPWNVEKPNYEQSFFFKSAKLTGLQEYIEKGKSHNLI